MKKKGFTLIELLLVITIIGLLASIVLIALNTARKKSRDTRRVADMKQIKFALQLYYDSTGSYPVTGATAAATALAPAYIAQWPTDPITAAKYPYFGAIANPGVAGSNTCTAIPCQFFHTGAAVEDRTITEMATDADRCPTAVGVCAASNGASTILADTAIYGTDGLSVGSNCTGTAVTGRGCYDQTP